MHSELKKSRKQGQRRVQRVRKKIKETSRKPRLCVVKTNRHLRAQLIDDQKGITLGSVSTLSKEWRDTEFRKKNISSAKKLGEKMATIAKDCNIQEVVFDRGRASYHGILAEFADAVRAGGLVF